MLTPLTFLQALRRALSDWRTCLFTLGYMAIVGSSILTYFFSTLVEGLGYEGKQCQYGTVTIYVVAFVCNAITGYLSDKMPHYGGLLVASWPTLSICSIAVCAVFNSKARFVLLGLSAAGSWSSDALTLSYASSVLGDDGRGVRAVSLAFVEAMGNLK